MVDWMIEVLTNFKCEDQTFFLAVNLLDRFFKVSESPQEICDLHILGVTSMFIASKFEDVHPLKMKMVYEKIAHKKLSIEKIKSLELEFLKVIHYKIAAPTILDFLKVYLRSVLQIEHISQDENQAPPESGSKVLIYKMALYLGKMACHDYSLSGKIPSLVGVGCLYVALKICE